jgi:hypothetical protein
MSSLGEKAVRRKSRAAPRPTIANRRPGRAGSGGGGSILAGVAGAAGAAETCTGGGGHVFSPSRTTVIARWTTSSKSSTSRPSFSGVSSVIRLTTFCPYSCEAWAGSRAGRSV